MRQCMDADNLHRRLKKIIGQVQAIRCTGITGNDGQDWRLHQRKSIKKSWCRKL